MGVEWWKRDHRPDGSYVVPAKFDALILHAELDLERVRQEAMTLMLPALSPPRLL